MIKIDSNKIDSNFVVLGGRRLDKRLTTENDRLALYEHICDVYISLELVKKRHNIPNDVIEKMIDDKLNKFENYF